MMLGMLDISKIESNHDIASKYLPVLMKIYTEILLRMNEGVELQLASIVLPVCCILIVIA